MADPTDSATDIEATDAPAPAPSTAPVTPEDPLLAARKALASAHKDARDRAETTLLQARDAAVPHLVDALLDDNREAQGVSPVPRATLLLMALRARAALPALYAVVEREHTSADELAFVARALAELLEGQDAFDDRARAALEKLAASSDRSTRAFAAQAYGSLGDLRSKARVQALARDSDAWVREKAAAVLAKLAETEALANESVAAATTPIDFAALVDKTNAEGGPLKPFLDDLGDARRPVRAAAVAELVRAGKSAVPFLLDKLNQPNTRARISAAIALGQLQNTEAAGPLLVAATAPASTSEEQELRSVALRSLASCLTGQEEGLAASILPLSRDNDRFVRAAALLCLGRLADRQGLHAIVAAILEDDPFVVESAAVALSEGVRESDVDVVLPLLAALDRRASTTAPVKSGAGAAVKEAILLALSRIQIDSPALRVRVRHRVRREVTPGAASTSSARKASIALLEKLYDSEQADPPPVPLVDDVLARLHDDHPEVRVVAASFVRAHLEPGMTGAVAMLSQALRRGENTVSLLVLEALRRHDTSEAKAALEQAAAAPPTGSAAAVVQRAKELLVDFVPHTTTWQHLSKLPQPATLPPRAESTRPPQSADPKDPKQPRVRTPGDDGGNVVEARFDDK